MNHWSFRTVPWKNESNYWGFCI